MYDLPEPPHNLVICSVALVVRRLLECLKVQLGQATDAQLELLGTEELSEAVSINLLLDAIEQAYGERRRITDALEAAHEGAELLLDGTLEQPLDVQVDVLLPVGVRNRDVLSAGLQCVVLGLAEDFRSDLEGLADIALIASILVSSF